MLEMSYQRRIKDRPAYGQEIVQAISQIYGQIKLAREIPFVDELCL